VMSVSATSGTRRPRRRLKVVTATICGVVRLAAGTCTVRAVELLTTGVAATAVPLKSTCVPLTRPGNYSHSLSATPNFDPDATVRR